MFFYVSIYVVVATFSGCVFPVSRVLWHVFRLVLNQLIAAISTFLIIASVTFFFLLLFPIVSFRISFIFSSRSLLICLSILSFISLDFSGSKPRGLSVVAFSILCVIASLLNFSST